MATPLTTQRQEALSEWIDRWLAQAEREWSDLPRVAAEIDSWDLLEQLDFTESWPLAEMRLEKLASSAEAMSQAQRERYRSLLALVDAHRPILERLRA